MRSGTAANRIAAMLAGAAALLAIGFLRMRGIPVLVAAGVVYLGTLALLWPKPVAPRIVLPKGIRKSDFVGVEQALTEGADLLRQHARIGICHGEDLAEDSGRHHRERIDDHLRLGDRTLNGIGDAE